MSGDPEDEYRNGHSVGWDEGYATALRGLRATLDSALDDLPRYMTVSQPINGWLPGDPDRPTMKACVYVDDVREMLRRAGRTDA